MPGCKSSVPHEGSPLNLQGTTSSFRPHPRRPGWTAASIARVHLPVHDCGSLHPMARSHSIGGHDYFHLRTCAHRQLDRPLRSSTTVVIRLRSTVHVRALVSHGQAPRGAIEPDHSVSSTSQRLGGTFPQALEVLPTGPPHRSQLG